MTLTQTPGRIVGALVRRRLWPCGPAVARRIQVIRVTVIKPEAAAADKLQSLAALGPGLAMRLLLLVATQASSIMICVQAGRRARAAAGPKAT